MIRIEGLHKALSGNAVLRGIDLHVAPGEVVALVGPSGTGKSVLLKHIIGLLQPDAGTVEVRGVSVGTADYRTLASLRARMGYVFQDAALLDSLTVRENLRLALDDVQCARNPLHAPLHIADALRTVRLHEGVLEQLPGQLSGGMRKRVGVARAIINRPEILLYDEPTTGLDPATCTAIDDLILQARDALGATSVVITHQLSALPRIADRVVLLRDGRVRFSGSPREFMESQDELVVSFRGHLRQEGPWQDTPAITTS